MLRDPYCQRSSLDAALRAHGCTLYSLQWLRRWASDGDEAPRAQPVIDKAVWDLQRDSGATLAEFLDRGTKLSEAEVAFEHDPFTGRTDPAMRLFRGGNVRTDLIPALSAGANALVCVDYGVIVDAGFGFGSFRGGHACVAGNPHDGKVDFVDPLRHQTIRLPIDVLEKAMEEYGEKPWHNGRGEFGTVVKSRTWLEVARADRDRYKAQRDAARKLIGLYEAKLAACEAQPPVPPDIAAARAQGIADAAAAAKAVV